MEARYFKIGVFVLASLGIGVVFLVAFAARDRGPALTFETYFEESVQGLEVGSPVRIQGVALGKVDSIGFVLTRYGVEAGLVRVVFSCRTQQVGQPDLDLVEERLKQWVTEGFRVRLASGGLVGGAYLEMSRVDPEEHPVREISWTPVHDRIPSMPSVMDQLQADAIAVAKDLKEADIAGTVAKLKSTLDAVEGVVRGKELAAILANLRGGTSDLPGAVTRLEKRLDEGIIKNLEDLVSRLDGVVVNDLGPVSDNLKQITKDLAADLPTTMRRINGVISKLDVIMRREGMDVQESLRSLNGLLADLKSLTEAAQRHPSAVLFGDPPPRSRRDRGK